MREPLEFMQELVISGFAGLQRTQSMPLPNQHVQASVVRAIDPTYSNRVKFRTGKPTENRGEDI